MIAHRGVVGDGPRRTRWPRSVSPPTRRQTTSSSTSRMWADGEILVVHDSDLMKAGGRRPRSKIWQTEAARGSAPSTSAAASGAQFAAERVPTLAEALAVCKGRARSSSS